jgi:hypothetical protein
VNVLQNKFGPKERRTCTVPVDERGLIRKRDFPQKEGISLKRGISKKLFFTQLLSNVALSNKSKL